MVKNVFVKVPKIGDAVVGNRSTKEILFITHESLSVTDLDKDKYEFEGVVGYRYGREVCIVSLRTDNRQWINTMIVEVQGAQLDGITHTGTISYYSFKESRKVDVNVSYTATKPQQVVDAINASILGNTEMIEQNWHTYIHGSQILISFDLVGWEQINNTSASGGLVIDKSVWLNNINKIPFIRNNAGIQTYYGSIMSSVRALNFYAMSKSASEVEGNVTTPLKDLTARQYPINKSSYLGKSYDGKDYCAQLRSKYGEGEQGWLNCMSAFKLLHSQYTDGLIVRDGQKSTVALASKTSYDGVSIAPAADYCLHFATELLPAGTWHLPTLEELYSIMENVSYPILDVDKCVINTTIAKMAGQLISLHNSYWICSMSILEHAYAYFGPYGTIHGNNMYLNSGVIPVTIYTIGNQYDKR